MEKGPARKRSGLFLALSVFLEFVLLAKGETRRGFWIPAGVARQAPHPEPVERAEMTTTVAVLTAKSFLR